MSNSKWVYMGLYDDDHLYDEDGNSCPITTDDYEFSFGKYNGLTMSQVSDKGYLLWLQESNLHKKPSDWYLDRIITIRLKELS